jgi:muramoyltetrapeptide carboxypeptidase
MKRKDFLKTVGLGSAAIPFLDIQRDGIKSDKIIKPKRLKEGDTVALTAPAGIIYDEEQFDDMASQLRSFGLNVRFGEFVKKRYGYFSGTDHQRALDLNRFFADDEIDGIVAVRGGWGCSRILPFLDFDLIRENPKIYCGFSDNTTLHMAFLSYCGFTSFHGPNGNSEWTDLTQSSFKDVLMKGEKVNYISNSRVDRISSGVASGRFIGGNLTILTTALGTDYQPNTEGAILFVEDVGEPVYKIDRMLTHLHRAGVMDGIHGFIFGRCTNCEKERSENDFTLKQILDHHIKPLGVPAIFGADIGHEKDNFTIPIGLLGTLNADQGVFSLDEEAVL